MKREISVKEYLSQIEKWIDCNHKCVGTGNEHLADCSICIENLSNWDGERGWMVEGRSYTPI
ncbi:MAG: hypothetical protein OEL89_01295 [Candidatus Peregrinibacteria bacterium]|nr:hypothetical protein [Candidatus Peregrinibacteria bacterium]